MSTCITPNADVSGLGIRLNLYITALILALIPDNSDAPQQGPGGANTEAPRSNSALLREVISGSAAISGLSLLITAIAQTKNNNLSLFHAIFVIHGLYFTGLAVAPAGRYRTDNNIARLIRVLLTVIVVYGGIVMFIGYSLYVWAKASSFGNSPQCNNQIKYILFFHPVRATAKWLRGLWIAALVITFGVLILSPIALARFPRLFDRLRPRSRSLFYLYWAAKRLSRLLLAIYGVAMLELYVKRNRHLIGTDEQQWTFGQIMALVQILSILNEVVHCLISTAPATANKIRSVWTQVVVQHELPAPPPYTP